MESCLRGRIQLVVGVDIRDIASRSTGQSSDYIDWLQLRSYSMYMVSIYLIEGVVGSES